MGFVLDASAAATWFFEDEFDEASATLAARLATEGAFAPAIWPLEMLNIFTSAVRRQRIDSKTATAFGKKVMRLEVDIEPTEGKPVEKALGIALRHSLSLYDATYVELAHRRRVPLATRDGRLKEVARSLKITVL
jgi:predicted nucleic acid-binding protein